MNLYISDLHFGHTNVIRFDNRPFADRDEMAESRLTREVNNHEQNRISSRKRCGNGS